MTRVAHKALKAILIAGPTASGKSALALELAEQLNGALINADASQVYAELRILSARPSAVDEARAPHLLYGHVPARERYSVARWLADAREAVAKTRGAGRLPIVVGGTGLYFTATLEGIADVPPIPAHVREASHALYEDLGPEAFNKWLARLDPEAAFRWPAADRARSLRAYEVVVATGRPLAEWHKEGQAPLFARDEVERFALVPDRAVLYARCDQRFDEMMKAGAMEEVRALLALNLDPHLPAMKAVGVEELAQVARGTLALEAAVERAKRRTRNYVKRQLTWIRHQMADWLQFATADASAVRREIGEAAC
ncbi:MAG: tRNA (adenosine(37)-N6)-dimethylallyltransferase MiaA [Alphaproteobacteria bacterium]